MYCVNCTFQVLGQTNSDLLYNVLFFGSSGIVVNQSTYLNLIQCTAPPPPFSEVAGNATNNRPKIVHLNLMTKANFAVLCLAANLSIRCPLTVDVLFNTTATIFVNSTGSLLPKVISSSNLAYLTSNIPTSANGLFNLSTIWNTSRDLAFNSTNNIKWTAMYTFKECSASVHRPNAKQNCEFVRKPVTCTTKIAVYSKIFFVSGLLLTITM